MSTSRFLTLLSAVTVTAVVASSGRTASVVASALQSHSYEDEIQSQIEFGKQLDVIDGELRRQIQIKDMLVLELIAGRTTLEQVSSEFLLINQSQPGSTERLRKDYVGDTDEERTARNVIGFVAAELAKESPLRRASVLTRLQVELEQMREKSPMHTFPSH
ncbi:MAG: hypothetical protein K8U57_24495 [Planctomycetes bacterium]|nr:hypothetical protein [Planctomycetota bacterium]